MSYVYLAKPCPDSSQNHITLAAKDLPSILTLTYKVVPLYKKTVKSLAPISDL